MITKYMLSICLAVVTAGSLTYAHAQDDSLQHDIVGSHLKAELDQVKAEMAHLKQDLDQKNNDLRNEIGNYTPIGLVLFLFGGFCALWAQDTGRNPWSWFFAGMLFSILAVIVMIIKNAEGDRFGT